MMIIIMITMITIMIMIMIMIMIIGRCTFGRAYPTPITSKTASLPRYNTIHII